MKQIQSARSEILICLKDEAHRAECMGQLSKFSVGAMIYRISREKGKNAQLLT